MSNYIDLAAGVGDVIEVALECHSQQSSTTASIAKAIAPCAGRVVAVSAWVDTLGGTTKCTDYDIVIEKGTTDLNTAIAAVNSSTNQGPQMGVLTTTAASLKVAAGDIFHLDGTLAGGASPTVDGIHGRVYMVRE